MNIHCVFNCNFVSQLLAVGIRCDNRRSTAAAVSGT
jgi:hypothetical protein